MRADRLIQILILLKNSGKLTTKELAKELGVTDRTIHRDMEALSATGIPVYSERGKGGGWKLIDGWASKLSWLKNNELETLFIPYSDKLLSDLGIEEAASAAREKLIASTESEGKIDAIRLWNRVYVDAASWRGKTEAKTFFTEIKEALFTERKIKISYEKFNGDKDERIIEPLGLVAKADKWYLVALKNGEYRNYRVSRIAAVEILEDIFQYPEDFNLQRYWETSKQRFIKELPTFAVEVKADRSIIERLKFTGRFVDVIKMDDAENDWIPVQLSFNAEQEAAEYILGFGKKMKAVTPAYLQTKIAQMAKDVVDLYF